MTVSHSRRAASSIRRLASSGNRIENEAVYGPSNSASVSLGNFISVLDLTECIVLETVVHLQSEVLQTGYILIATAPVTQQPGLLSNARLQG